MPDQDYAANTFTVTVPVPAIWLHVFQARKFKSPTGKETGEPKFDTTFLFGPDHPELPDIKRLLGRVATEAFGSVEGVKFPVQAGDKRIAAAKAKAEKAGKTPSDLSFLAGKLTLTTRSSESNPPRLSVAFADQIKEFLGDERSVCKPHFYSGVECLAEIYFKAYEMDDNRYVTAYLNKLCSTRKGDKIDDGAGGGNASAATFGKYVGKVSAENPIDDEIPF